MVDEERRGAESSKIQGKDDGREKEEGIPGENVILYK